MQKADYLRVKDNVPSGFVLYKLRIFKSSSELALLSNFDTASDS